VKFLPENRKKTVGALALILVSIGGTVYINFFMGKSNVPTLPATAPTAMDGAPAPQSDMPPPGGESPTGAPPATTGTGQSSTPLLPYGSKIDISIFDSDKFKVLKGIPRVEVTNDELGKIDPFKK